MINVKYQVMNQVESIIWRAVWPKIKLLPHKQVQRRVQLEVQRRINKMSINT